MVLNFSRLIDFTHDHLYFGTSWEDELGSAISKDYRIRLSSE